MTDNGEQAVVHRVRSGESLSGTTSKYGFRNSKSIYSYKAKVNCILGANADELTAESMTATASAKPAVEYLARTEAQKLTSSLKAKR